uniref:Ig-like domain-containing protein n=1 Tax=Castor canadensis TaxID=51338 RepID=A0A8C0VYZ1_CASCN
MPIFFICTQKIRLVLLGDRNFGIRIALRAALRELALFLIIPTGSSVAQKVTQVLTAKFRRMGEEVSLDCSYETSRSAYYLFWYKQLPSGEMNFLISQHSGSGNARRGRYSVLFQKSVNRISLIISDLKLEDSAKYFCTLREAQ